MFQLSKKEHRKCCLSSEGARHYVLHTLFRNSLYMFRIARVVCSAYARHVFRDTFIFERSFKNTYNFLSRILSQVVALYRGLNRKLVFDSQVHIHWPGDKPASDIPYCGFTGKAEHCQQTDGIYHTLAFNTSDVGFMSAINVCMCGLVLLIFRGQMLFVVLYQTIWLLKRLIDNV